jgi:eukaryotic-like serine/threonine-protein kinase
MTADLPRSFGPYALLSLVGRGGMGEVYLAKTGGLQGYEKHCVVKTLRADVASDSEYAQRFSEEARVVVQLAHRNICSVFDVGRVDESLYVAMEHIVGRDLRQLAKNAPVPVPIAIYVATEVLEAVDYAHRFVDATTGEALSLVHRDVSPQNILLGVEGDVKLIDFGVATSTRLAPVTQAGTVLGKLNYMAPEHARGEQVDGRADQWSAAVVLTELLTNQGFYDGVDRQRAWAISGKGTHRPPGFADIEPSLRALIDRALSPLRDDRFPTCSAFAAALAAWAREHGGIADTRDVRKLLLERFGDLASEARGTYRSFASVKPPLLEPVGPGQSPWESIATTMMVAPPTTGVDHIPSTMVVRDRSPVKTRPLPPSTRPSNTRIALAFAAGGSLSALVALIAVSMVRTPEPVEAAPPPRAPDAGVVFLAAIDAGAPPIVIEEPDEDPVAEGGPDEAESGTDRPKHTAPVKQRLRYDKATRADLTFLAGECRVKVPCAQNILDWSKRAHLEAERAELADAAASCARTCRLK